MFGSQTPALAVKGNQKKRRLLRFKGGSTKQVSLAESPHHKLKRHGDEAQLTSKLPKKKVMWRHEQMGCKQNKKEVREKTRSTKDNRQGVRTKGIWNTCHLLGQKTGGKGETTLLNRIQIPTHAKRENHCSMLKPTSSQDTPGYGVGPGKKRKGGAWFN